MTDPGPKTISGTVTAAVLEQVFAPPPLGKHNLRPFTETFDYDGIHDSDFKRANFSISPADNAYARKFGDDPWNSKLAAVHNRNTDPKRNQVLEAPRRHSDPTKDGKFRNYDHAKRRNAELQAQFKKVRNGIIHAHPL